MPGVYQGCVEQAMAGVCALSPAGADLAVEHGVTEAMFTDPDCAAVYKAAQHPTARSAWYDATPDRDGITDRIDKRVATVAMLAHLPLATVQHLTDQAPSASDASGAVAAALTAQHTHRVAAAAEEAAQVADVEAWRNSPHA